MAARKIRGRWYVDFRFNHPEGREERVRKRSPVDTKRGAVEFERKLRGEMLNPTPVQKEVPTFEEFAKEFMATYVRVNNSPSECRSKETWFRLYLVPFFGHMRLSDISTRDVDRFKATLAHLSPKSVRNALAALGKVLRYAMEIELIDRVPRMRGPKVPPQDFDFLTFEESDRLLQAARDHFPEWHPMLFTALRTGLRFGELVELRWGDVDLVSKKLRVMRAFAAGHVGSPKSGKARVVPMTSATVEVLKGHRHLRPLVFSDRSGARFTHIRAYDKLHAICRRAGLRTVGWHVLRHTFASHLAMRGVSMRQAQELLGHGSLAMTLRYAHLSPDSGREAVECLDGLGDKERHSTDRSGHYLGTPREGDSVTARNQ